MSLFSSEIVVREMQHISKLYGDLQNTVSRPNFKEDATHDEKVSVINQMERLIELSEVMHARIMLSDDPECVKQKEEYRIEAKKLGLPPNPIPKEVFSFARQSIDEWKQILGVDTE